MIKTLTLIALVVMADPAMAQIRYTDIEPDNVYTNWDAYELVLGSGQMQTLYIWKHPTDVSVNAYSADVQILVQDGLPLALEAGVPIGSNGAWVAANYQKLNDGGTSGHWIGVADRYLAMRVKIDGAWRYGWVRMDINQAPSQLTIKDHALQLTPNTPINAGDRGQASVDREGTDSMIGVERREDAILIPSSMSGNATIYSVLGQEQSITPLNGAITELSLHTLPAGAYLLVVRAGAERQTFKLSR